MKFIVGVIAALLTTSIYAKDFTGTVLTLDSVYLSVESWTVGGGPNSTVSMERLKLNTADITLTMAKEAPTGGSAPEGDVYSGSQILPVNYKGVDFEVRVAFSTQDLESAGTSAPFTLSLGLRRKGERFFRNGGLVSARTVASLQDLIYVTGSEQVIYPIDTVNKVYGKFNTSLYVNKASF
ncbi:hypothetical protein K2X33_04255 [bacterium]|nr:hypothetical protein [bacterium]